jgi:hypothetical protein
MSNVAANGYGEKLQKVLARLTDLSRNNFYNAFERFEWPESLPGDALWMSPELMTVYGTRAGSALGEDQLIRLSKWESIGFYSFNVHGERYLIREVLERIHTPGFEQVSEYMHHFIGEENVHSWFFAKFCYSYGHKIYPAKSWPRPPVEQSPDIESFLVFARILILEEMVDYYNIFMEHDKRLPPLIRHMNGTHHFDEARHVAFGRNFVRELYANISGKHPEEKLREISDYLERYIRWCIESLYNLSVYRDAGIGEAYEFRTAIMNDPARASHHEAITKGVRKFLRTVGVFPDNTGAQANV